MCVYEPAARPVVVQLSSTLCSCSFVTLCFCQPSVELRDSPRREVSAIKQFLVLCRS